MTGRLACIPVCISLNQLCYAYPAKALDQAETDCHPAWKGCRDKDSLSTVIADGAGCEMKGTTFAEFLKNL